jgi:fibro-slime domain-containing protein
MRLSWSLPLVTSLFAAGCSEDPVNSQVLGPGTGGASTAGGAPPVVIGMGGSSIVVPPGGGAGGNAGSGGGECIPRPIGLLRDFKAEHPDFEYALGAEKGIVAVDLDVVQRKPVFANQQGLRTVHTAAEFDQWYRDDPLVNMTREYQIPFTNSASGTAVFDSTAFFPLDDQLFGNEGRRHNYHFTFELHMEFLFAGNEVFTFRGDDDVFVFINNKLAIDLGGVHTAQTASINLAEAASMLGITPGNRYPIDFFQAERHTSESNFRIETNLAFTNCTPIIIR